jgi:hypothetical protein
MGRKKKEEFDALPEPRKPQVRDLPASPQFLGLLHTED